MIDQSKPMFSLTVGEYIKLHQTLMYDIKPENTAGIKEKDLLTIQEAAEYLNLSVATLYSMNCRKQVPFTKVIGKVYYRRSVLDFWLASGDRKTTAQLKAEAQERAKL